MLKKRLIAVLIVRDGQVVQSKNFKHTNVIHYDPIHAMESFNKWAVDEIVLLNVSRDAQSAKAFPAIVERVSKVCFVPLSVGGWIESDSYAHDLLNSGADKLVFNTAFAHDPDLVRRLSRRLGQQCIVASIDVKRVDDTPLVHVDRGSENTGKSATEWARYCIETGAGEIFFNSIDHDGARRGYDLATLGELCNAVDVPVIAFGGVLFWKHLKEGLDAGAQAASAANIFHYTEQATRAAKTFLADQGVNVRKEGRSYSF